MYTITGFLKFSEVDNYQEGCDPDTAQLYEVSAYLSGNTPAELIEKIDAAYRLEAREFSVFIDPAEYLFSLRCSSRWSLWYWMTLGYETLTKK